MNNKIILSQITEIAEVRSVNKAAQMLSSGEWIAVCATVEAPVTFCLCKVKSQADPSQVYHMGNGGATKEDNNARIFTDRRLCLRRRGADTQPVDAVG